MYTSASCSFVAQASAYFWWQVCQAALDGAGRSQLRGVAEGFLEGDFHSAPASLSMSLLQGLCGGSCWACHNEQAEEQQRSWKWWRPAQEIKSQMLFWSVIETGAR